MQPLIWPVLPVRAVGTFQDRGRWLVPTLAVMLALGLAGFMAAKPAYRYLRTQRALGLVAKGEALAAEHRWREVEPLLKSALALAPTHVRCHRLALRYLTAGGMGQAALNHAQHIVASGAATYEECRDLAVLATTLGRTDLSRPMLQKLLRERPDDTALYRASLLLARRLKMEEMQVETAERWMRVDPAAPEPQFELGSLRWRSTNAANRAAGRHLLWGLAFGNTSYTLPAIAALAYGTNLARTEVDLLWRRLDSLAPTNRWDKAEIRTRLRPHEMATIVGELVGALTPESDAPEIGGTIKWLADHGAVAEILPLLTPERLARIPRLEAARVQALIELGRHDEMRELLNSSATTNLPPHLLHLLRASAAHAEGKSVQVARHLELAGATAGDQPFAHLVVAKFAEQLKQPRAALERWQLIARNFGTGLDAAMQIVRLARIVDDLSAAQPALSALRSQMATDVGAALAAGYVDGLLGPLRPELVPQLREIARTNTPAAHITAILALAEWRAGDPTAALRAVESTSLDWSRAESRFQAVYAAILGAAGQREAARFAARRVNPAGLAREEKALLEPWL